MSTIKQQRTAEQIRELLSEILVRETADPRLQDVTVTEVRIDRELQFAHIYVNALGGDERKQDVMAALDHASGFLRRELAQNLRLRTMPQINFRWDPTPAQAERINQLLDTLEIPAADEPPAST